ncbi:hypothetical protein PDJAM_G00073980 [Pangasius djambal]|uniref:Uncharacterized protein n=1 Tax=Pangasius djambal TaxID=1691987 RepID=A0ACC5Z278_9TELE|nr:hypothetical protein [Pangasius djambal]
MPEQQAHLGGVLLGHKLLDAEKRSLRLRCCSTGGKEGAELYRPAPLSGEESCLAEPTGVELLDELHLH